jgi:hypothetical protein
LKLDSLASYIYALPRNVLPLLSFQLLRSTNFTSGIAKRLKKPATPCWGRKPLRSSKPYRVKELIFASVKRLRKFG